MRAVFLVGTTLLLSGYAVCPQENRDGLSGALVTRCASGQVALTDMAGGRAQLSGVVAVAGGGGGDGVVPGPL